MIRLLLIALLSSVAFGNNEFLSCYTTEAAILGDVEVSQDFSLPLPQECNVTVSDGMSVVFTIDRTVTVVPNVSITIDVAQLSNNVSSAPFAGEVRSVIIRVENSTFDNGSALLINGGVNNGSTINHQNWSIHVMVRNCTFIDSLLRFASQFPNGTSILVEACTFQLNNVTTIAQSVNTSATALTVAVLAFDDILLESSSVEVRSCSFAGMIPAVGSATASLLAMRGDRWILRGTTLSLVNLTFNVSNSAPTSSTSAVKSPHAAIAVLINPNGVWGLNHSEWTINQVSITTEFAAWRVVHASPLKLGNASFVIIMRLSVLSLIGGDTHALDFSSGFTLEGES